MSIDVVPETHQHHDVIAAFIRFDRPEIHPEASKWMHRQVVVQGLVLNFALARTPARPLAPYTTWRLDRDVPATTASTSTATTSSRATATAPSAPSATAPLTNARGLQVDAERAPPTEVVSIWAAFPRLIALLGRVSAPQGGRRDIRLGHRRLTGHRGRQQLPST